MNTQRRLFFSQLATIVAGIVSAAFLRFIPGKKKDDHILRLTPVDDYVQYYTPSDYPFKSCIYPNPGGPDRIKLEWESRLGRDLGPGEKPIFMSNVGDPKDWDYKPGNIREVAKDGWHTGPFPIWDKKKLESERELERLIRKAQKNYEFTPPLERP